MGVESKGRRKADRTDESILLGGGMLMKKLKKLFNVDLDKYGSVTVRVKKTYLAKGKDNLVKEFIFSRERIFLPSVKSAVDCEVTIMTCEVGKNFTFYINDKNGTIMTCTSEGKVKSIKVYK
ncbi:MAG: hypothetical protein ABH830_04705 [Patescibacteria group bacterium]